MSKIISIQSRQEINAQNYEENCKLIEKSGRYIGCLPKQDTKYFRQYIDKLQINQTLLDELMCEWQDDYDVFLNSLQNTLIGLKMKIFNPENDNVCIDINGNLWFVPKSS